MVLFNYAGPNRGHVAVVRALVDTRTIKVDHANWLDDGAIYTDDPVRDVSAANDWSQVRVFNLRTGAWGSRIYPVQGFIGPGPDNSDRDSDPLIARAPKRDAIAARVAHIVAFKENPKNLLIFHAMGPNLAGVFGTAISGGILLALLGV